MKRFPCLLASLLLAAGLSASAQVRESEYPETWVQYAPLVLDMGLELCAVKPQNNWVDRFAAGAAAYVVEAVATNILKYTVCEVRPDGSTANSFPSGHSATVFMGAELVREEYGPLWGALGYGSGAYVAAMRVVHGRHYWWDTVAGAAIGILSARAGYALLPMIQDAFGKWGVYDALGLNRNGTLDTPLGELSLVPAADPLTGAFTPAAILRF